MKVMPLILACGVAAQAGCASAPPPSVAAAIPLHAVASTQVGVLQPRWRAPDGPLEIEGYVYKKVGAGSTARTHIDVTYFDAAGHALKVETVNFEPRELRRAPRPPAGRGRYIAPVAEVPAETAAIELRAHDGEHALNG